MKCLSQNKHKAEEKKKTSNSLSKFSLKMEAKGVGYQRNSHFLENLLFYMDSTG